jgi:hypothetical protein
MTGYMHRSKTVDYSITLATRQNSSVFLATTFGYHAGQFNNSCDIPLESADVVLIVSELCNDRASRTKPANAGRRIFMCGRAVGHTVYRPREQRAFRIRRISSDEYQFLYNFGYVTTMEIVQLIYRPTEVQGHAKDYEFSRATMQARWAQGLSDAQTTLLASPWLAPMPPEVGARTFDVLREVRTGRARPARAFIPVK